MVGKETILASLSHYQYISFDVFDTLIFRTFCHFTDVFEAVEMECMRRYKKGAIGFKDARIRAEREARKLRKGKDVTLDMIYNCLPYENDLRNVLKEIEKDVEVLNCVPNQVMVDVVNECRKCGKIIVITTDMYLPRDVFNRIFSKIGIEYDYLFISGEVGVTKRSGDLFPIILNRLGIMPSDLVHIGDDLNNDIIQPNKYGIKAIEGIQDTMYSVPYSVPSDNKNICGNHLNSFLARGLQSHAHSADFVLGYTIVGPLLWEFCEWIHRIREAQGLDKLLFVAREGWLIKKCYERMYPEDKGFVGYICLNKNLLRLPSLAKGDVVDKFIRSIPMRTVLQWKDILKYLAIEDYNEFILILRQQFGGYDFDKSVYRKDLLNNNKVKYILQFVIEYQKKTIKDQCNMLFDYLDRFGFLTNRIGLVNNSMNGSGQSLIEEFLINRGITPHIYGIQFVRSHKCVSLLSDRSAGWINDFYKPSYKTAKFGRNSLLLEHMLFEPQGTAVSFIKSNSGEIDALCEQPRKEIENIDVIASIQEAALLFIQEYKDCLPIAVGKLGYERYLRFLLFPRKEEAMLLCNLWDDDVEEDKQLVNITEAFRKKNCLLIGMPKNAGWFEGWFAVAGIANIYRRIAYVMSLLRYCYWRYKPFANRGYC